MKKCRARSAVLADGVKAPLSLTLRRKTKLKEQLTTGIIMKLFQSIWNAIHQTRERGSTDLIRKLGVLLRKRGMFDSDALIQHLTPAANMRGEINTDLTDTPAQIVPQQQFFKVAMNTHGKGHFKSLNSQQLLARKSALRRHTEKVQCMLLCHQIKATRDWINP